MSATNTIFFTSKNNRKLTPKYYIVKDDFITNLRKDSKIIKPKRQMTEPKDSSFLASSSQMVKKKEQIMSKLKFKGNNDFYELQKQIKSNTRNIYRKLTIALRKTRMDFKIQLQNPFTRSQTTVSEQYKKQKFDKDKNLSDLIMQVQPYWIKKYIGKSVKPALN